MFLRDLFGVVWKQMISEHPFPKQMALCRAQFVKKPSPTASGAAYQHLKECCLGDNNAEIEDPLEGFFDGIRGLIEGYGATEFPLQ